MHDCWAIVIFNKYIYQQKTSYNNLSRHFKVLRQMQWNSEWRSLRLNHGIRHHRPVSDVSQAICLHYVLFR